MKACNSRFDWRTGASAAVMVLALTAAANASAQTSDTAPPAANDAQAATEQDQTGEEIVVSGFRQSLEAALNVKRNSVSSVDAIVAEDIAKFPDQNLAESLQRIPGISIQRDGGEGRAITVRGLGSQFTRVRVNGLETVATSHDGASSNRDRAFDFNVFASELFTSIVVHKTAEASLDEGSLGAVVDLNTGNPLAGKSGFTVVASGQGSYNDLSENWGPRVAGLIGWKSPDGTLGASISAAWQKTDTLELGNNTVRWAQARFDSVNGAPCFYSANAGGNPVANAGGNYRPSAACDAVGLAFHPRIPRYGEVRHDRERLGITGSIQWAPTDATKISIDGLFSRFKEDREEKWGEVLLRSNERSIDVSNYTIDGNNNLIAATLNDAWVRTEHFLKRSETEFYQIGGSWDQDVGENFRFTLLGGISKSNANVPIETTFVYDDRDAQGYRYDYSDMNRPVLTFGTSVTNPANFQLAEIRDRPSNVTNKFRTAQLRTEWDVTEGFQIKAGGLYRRFEFESEAFTRDTVVCGNGGLDRVLGTVTCSASSAFGPTAVYGLPVTADRSELFQLGNAGQPSGTSTEWLIPDLAATAAYTNLYSRPTAIDAGNTRGVVEEVKGGYLQFDARRDFGTVGVAVNAGIRYVRTDQSSQGLTSGAVVTVKRDYEDFLPAVNLAITPHRDLVIRAAIAKVMTRPTLGNLTPGGSVDGFNYRVNYGNPFLEPFRATAYDAGVEWYFAPGSIASVAVFRKEIQSFPASETRSGTFASTGLPVSIIPPSSPAAINPEGQLWTINSIGNGAGAELNGVELSLQAPFRFLPGFLSNFGGIVNATFVDSDADYIVAGPTVNACVPGATAAAACGFGGNPGSTRTSTLFGLSKKAFNGTLYYEDSRFSARASVSYRGPYNDANSGTGNVFEGYAAITNVDASIRYKLTSQIELSLEGTNLTDAYRERFTDQDAQRNYEYNHFGRTILVGARFKL
ncbi:TonB-dependent receptor [Sphingomonas sp. M1-B02]|uniref:TonB-dependent receptor n=1 Tax=Sphingomonas sp. M1-B02 TaxID=3114300 RepID=UPI00223FD59E|nr:TonB-dependent receptor [Sphingomonas sp. S6-11]UZK66337.1 TonB-dependent receptor [Sphingomonas sp. S6-11]